MRETACNMQQQQFRHGMMVVRISVSWRKRGNFTAPRIYELYNTCIDVTPYSERERELFLVFFFEECLAAIPLIKAGCDMNGDFSEHTHCHFVRRITAARGHRGRVKFGLFLVSEYCIGPKGLQIWQRPPPLLLSFLGSLSLSLSYLRLASSSSSQTSFATTSFPTPSFYNFTTRQIGCDMLIGFAPHTATTLTAAQLHFFQRSSAVSSSHISPARFRGKLKSTQKHGNFG